MKVETITSALIAAMIILITSVVDKFANGAVSISDISEASWWIMGGGAALQFLKDYQAISTRRFVAKLRGKHYEADK